MQVCAKVENEVKERKVKEIFSPSYKSPFLSTTPLCQTGTMRFRSVTVRARILVPRKDEQTYTDEGSQPILQQLLSAKCQINDKNLASGCDIPRILTREKNPKKGVTRLTLHKRERNVLRSRSPILPKVWLMLASSENPYDVADRIHDHKSISEQVG